MWSTHGSRQTKDYHVYFTADTQSKHDSFPASVFEVFFVDEFSYTNVYRVARACLGTSDLPMYGFGGLVSFPIECQARGQASGHRKWHSETLRVVPIKTLRSRVNTSTWSFGFASVLLNLQAKSNEKYQLWSFEELIGAKGQSTETDVEPLKKNQDWLTNRVSSARPGIYS